ncbi:MAG TPA: FapA family protein [Fibrobacteria bacterium]|nr:FapA family protein [Fibrobacteria bacterium]
MRVEVIPCNGGLGAQLRIQEFTSEDWKARFGDIESLHQLLSQAGIAQEFLDKPSLQIACNLLNEAGSGDSSETLEEVQAMIVASGVPPTDDEVVGLRLLKAYLMTEEELSGIKTRLAAEPFEVTEKSINPGCLVEKGDTILGFSSIRKGSPGVGVFGEPIPPRPESGSLPKPGNSILEENNKWMALKRGILVVEDNTFKILGPRTADDQCLLVSEDKMSVRLILRKSDDDDFKPSLGYLQQLIADQHYMHSPDMVKVRAALDAFSATGKSQDVVILTGKPSTPGKNGSLETLVDPEPKLPDPEKDGRIDFKSFSYFRTVQKGMPLTKLNPPVPGTVGLDVFGSPLMPDEVAPIVPTLGKNTEFTVSDPVYIVASCDGRLVFADGIPEVVDTLQITDDVSLKTGNIAFPGSIEVTGDVRDNLAITAKGDVDISGVVEDGCITSEGAIVVKGGFTGTGKGVIKSKLSSVSIGFIRNQRIESHSDIIVYNEVMNAYLCAKKCIVMKSMGHSVVGGHLIAYTGIEVFNAGNPTGAKTILEVGKDFEVEMALNQNKAALKEILADIEFLDRISAKMQNYMRWSSDVKGDMRLLEQRSRGVSQFLKPLRDAIAGQIKTLESKLYNPGDCYIWVKGDVFPGTMLRYQDRIVLVKEAARGKRWLFRGKKAAHEPDDADFPESA